MGYGKNQPVPLCGVQKPEAVSIMKHRRVSLAQPALAARNLHVRRYFVNLTNGANASELNEGKN